MSARIDALPELVFSSADDLPQAKRVSRLAQAGKLRKIHAGLYTSNLNSPLDAIVLRHWREIAERLAPGSVVGYRSAQRAGPEDGKVFLVTGRRAKRIRLPGLELVVVPGGAPIPEGPARDIPYGKLYVASEPRRLLENLSTRKGASERASGAETVEAFLERVLSLRGEPQLNTLRDAAREIAPKLHLNREYEALNRIVSALLRTRNARVLHAKSALARAAGRPYDPDRLPVFDKLFGALHQTAFEHPADPARRGLALENFAFFEAYFSNYIEGTVFTIEEAEDIIFRGKIMEKRHEDSHDIKGTFQAILNDPTRGAPPSGSDEFLAWLKGVNALVMQARPDKNPGEWKAGINRAGASLFVIPELVPGTLREGFERISALGDPLARALMVMFVVAEVHPFADGNGRTARIAMNAHLTAAGLARIMVPTVYREDYLLPLKALTHNLVTDGFISAMTRAQRWSASFDFDRPREEVKSALEDCNAFREDLRNYRLIFPEKKPD